MERFLLLLSLAFVCCLHIKLVLSFTAGVPPLPKVCRSVSPYHGNYTPQITESPFEITVEPKSVVGGDSVTVTLRSTTDRKFKGFYIQGRGEKGTPIGTFKTNKLTDTHSCFGVRWNAAHHASGHVEKDLVMISWQAPKNYEGEIFFIGSFVQNYVTIWTGVYAEPITVTMRNETELGQRGSNRVFRKPGEIFSSWISSGSNFLRGLFSRTEP